MFESGSTRGRVPDGYGVVVTRPPEQADTLCELIDAAGGRALRLPLLQIEALGPDSVGARHLQQAHAFHWLIFISTNAVRHGLEHLPAEALKDTNRPRIAAIGDATRATLERLGVTVDLAPKAQFNSEGLLALPEFNDMAAKRVLIIRGKDGREFLADSLRARGAEVEYAEVYRRKFPPVDVANLLGRYHAGDIQAITITSGEALDHLARQIGTQGLELIAGTPLIVVSERLAQQARALGFLNPVVTAAANDQAIFEAVAAAAADHDSKISNPYQPHGDTALMDEDKELALTDVQPEVERYAPSTSAGEPPVSSSPRGKRLATWLGYGTLILVIVLIGAGTFLLQELRSKQEGLGGELSKDDQQMMELTHQISSLQAELSAFHNQFATLQSRVTIEDSKFERQIGEQSANFVEKLGTLRGDLEESVHHIQRQLNKSRGDLMVADAEYLLSIANQKLHLVGDIKSVVAAMEAADQRLHDSGDPAVFKVREALAEEINLLKKFDAPDVVGISAKLLVMQSKIPELALFLPHADMDKSRQPEPEPMQPDEPKEGDSSLLNSTLKDFRDLVTVRRSDRPATAILEPVQAESLRQVLLLKLEMSRAALLRGDDAFYKANLETAYEWLQEHFDRKSPATQTMAEELKGLQAVQIRVPLPDVSKSLTLLRNIEKLRLEAEQGEAQRKPAPSLPAETAAPPMMEAPKSEMGAQP